MNKINPLLASLALIATAFFLAGCASTNTSTTANTPLAQQTPKQFKLTRKQTLAANYLLFLPRDYVAKSEKRWPLMLFLHGAGERGTDISKVAVHGPPKYVKDHPEFPFIVVSPQCPEGEVWSTELLMALLEEIERKYAVDPFRIYVTGLSMGGYGSWDLGCAHPEKFAAIMPICGGGQLIKVLLPRNETALKTLGVWAFHGGKDTVVPLEESQRMVEALKKKGARDVKLTVYPEANHDSWTETYNNPAVYQWLLEHKR